MTPDQQALVARFTGFLAKIEERLREIMTEAEQGVLGLLSQHPTDIMPLGNALSGLDHRVRELREKIQETWDQQIESKYRALNASGDAFLDHGLDQKQDAEQRFDELWATFKARANSQFYRNLFPLATAAAQKPLPCTQCGAPLEVADRSVSASIHCVHCGAVNQVVRDVAIGQYKLGGAHAFADEEVLPLRFEIERFRTAVDRQRRASSWANESFESLEQWHAMEQAYWVRYVEAKARFAGEPVDFALVESRMTQWRKYTLETNQIWRKGKGLA
jgi:hypothetical protein